MSLFIPVRHQEGEIWHPIDGFPYYFISNLGRVKSEFPGKPPRIRLPSVRRYGYKNIVLSKNALTQGFYVHRLVAIAFIPNPKDLPQVNHLDGNGANNRVDNLEWCTHAENLAHARKNRGDWLAPFRHAGAAKKAVIATDENGERLFESAVAAALAVAGKRNGSGNISNAIRSGREAYGFHWRFASCIG